MPDITATFRNKFGASKLWTVLDLGRDESAPSQIFRDYLEPDQVTVAPHGTGVRPPASLAAAGPAWVGGRDAWE